MVINDPEAMKQEILGYYVGLLGSSFDCKVDASPVLSQAIQTMVPLHLRDQLIVPVTRFEIKAALMSLMVIRPQALTDSIRCFFKRIGRWLEVNLLQLSHLFLKLVYS